MQNLRMINKTKEIIMKIFFCVLWLMWTPALLPHYYASLNFGGPKLTYSMIEVFKNPLVKELLNYAVQKIYEELIKPGNPPAEIAIGYLLEALYKGGSIVLNDIAPLIENMHHTNQQSFIEESKLKIDAYINSLKNIQL